MKTVTLASLLFTAATAAAETPAVHERGTMPAIDDSLEVAVALGSSTSVGDAGDGMATDELVGTAAQLELRVGRRMTPNFALAFYTSAQGLTTGSTRERDVYTGTAGLIADFHFRPRHAIDPWLGVGGGLAAMLVDDREGVALAVGVELARLQLGVDFRVSEDIAIGPVIGASAVLYGAQRTPAHDFAELDDKGINWTFSAGIAARFNKFGTRK